MNFQIVSFLNQIAHTNSFVAVVTSFISGPVSYVLFPAFFMLYVVLHTKNHMYWFSLVVLSGFFSWLCAVILKHIFMVARPFITHTTLNPLKLESGFSFPSEHASVYGALTYLAWQYDYRLGIITTTVGILVLLSRLFSGVHYPADVIIGFFVGASIASGFVFLFKKYLG